MSKQPKKSSTNPVERTKLGEMGASEMHHGEVLGVEEIEHLVDDLKR